MRCPTCSTEVPEARFCARCGDRLEIPASAPPSPDQGTPEILRTGRERPPVAVGRWAVVVVLALAVAPTPPPPPQPFVPSPSATVLCSDLSEHRVTYEWLGDAGIGDDVELHGEPCIVTAIDDDVR